LNHHSANRLVNSALAALLRLDGDAFARSARWLAPLVLKVHVSGINLTVVLEFVADEIRVVPAAEGDELAADIELAGPPAALLRLAANPDDESLLSNADVKLTGDAGKLQALRRWMRSLDLDWEEWLASHVGDIAAHQIGNMARSTHRWATQTGRDLSADVSDYLLAEAEIVPPKWVVHEWTVAVDRLRDDVARLEQRLRLLGQP
jgi:ubiquinone biosynthesis accessory factor UbiJ